VQQQFYPNETDQLRSDFAKSVSAIAKESNYVEKTSITRLKALRRQVKGNINLNKIGPSQKILNLFLDFSKNKQINRNERLMMAIEEFKQHSLDLTASEYVLVLHILRNL
jgi:hypothetical protein